MPEHQIHWTALPRSADAAQVELDVFVSPRLGVDALAPEYVLADFPELATWTARVAAGEVAFEVSFDGGPPVPASIVAQDPLDEELWAHLFPGSSPVQPWSFRDHSARPIRSFPVRWTVAYLRDLYKQVGQAGGSELPSPEDVDGLRPDLVGPIHTDVGEELDMDTEHRDPAGKPPAQPQGCLVGTLALLCLPLRRLCRWLRKLLGLGGTAPPPSAPPRGPVEFRYRPPAPRPTDPYAKLDAQLAAHGVVPSPDTGTAATIAEALEKYPIDEAFAQAMLFYNREPRPPGAAGEPPPPPPPPAEPRWDFHRRIGALGDYPTLMQRLGLTIRIRVGRPAAASGTVRVVARVGGAVRPAVDVTPATACELDGERFYAEPRPVSDLADGMLDLNGADDRLESIERAFDLVQLDADGAALKAIVATASLERRAQLADLKRDFTTDEPEPLPALRTAGIAIVRADRASGLLQRLREARKHSLGHGKEVLYADEIVRGYQVWVQKDGGEWRSLCERNGVYRLVDDEGELVDPSAIRAIEDRGFVKRSGATSKDEASELYLHETLVRWSGWSLVAPLPGRAVDLVDGVGEDPDTGDPVPVQEEKEEAKVSRAAEGFRLETRFSPAEKSLPRLRFGSRYRFAMVWVDLAGRPLAQLEKGPAAPGADAHVSEEIVFRRFEPVAPPSVLPFRRFTPGGSLERLVVRSDYNRSPAEWLADLGPGSGLDEHDDRRLFAPKTSQQMAELHGKFELAIGPGGNHAAGFSLGKREKGTFAKPQADFVGDPKEVDDYVVNRDENAVLVAPYLPDPIAAGIVLRDVPNLTQASDLSGGSLEVVTVPGLERPLLRIPFVCDDWPDFESVRIRVVGSDPDAGPHWNPEKRLLTIHLPKGAEAKVRYSCYLRPADLENMGAWDWLDDEELSDEVRKQARSGVHWMIAPWRTLTLVHALQRPLHVAEIGKDAVAKRAAGETAATIEATTVVDATTDRVDLLAKWKDWRDDDLDAPEFVEEPHQAVVGHWTHKRDKGDVVPPPPPIPAAPMPPQRQEFGDTRHRRVSYSLRATSRFREYLPPDTKLKLTRRGPARQVSVPASAPPDPPRVSYAVPAFGWRLDEGPSGDAVLAVDETLRRTRVGGGLRVFLERPWYSSGEGERLAVVMQGPDYLPSMPLSRVGTDPTVGEAISPESFELTPAAFTGAETKNELLLSERPGRVAIASFEPGYDRGRKLWACDVTFDMAALPWGEWPFVRLALARHQPDAVEGSHLSKVVLAQWAQLAPDRHLVVKRVAANQVDVELRGRGRVAPRSNRLVIGFERAAASSPDELDWRPADGAPPSELDADLWDAAIDPDVIGDELLWSKDVTVPNAEGDSLRLTVRELERRPVEGDVEAGAVRIAYADAVRLA